jgi:hypothetical protein
MHQARQVPLIARVALLIIVAMAAASAQADDGSVAMEVRLAPRDAAIGEPIRLIVSLTNIGDRPLLLLVRDANFVIDIQSAPGTYRIRVRYESERSAQERSAAVWRGSAPSKWIQIRLREPDSRERTRRLEQLEKCVRNDVCDSTEVGNFFRVVRDRQFTRSVASVAGEAALRHLAA